MNGSLSNHLCQKNHIFLQKRVYHLFVSLFSLTCTQTQKFHKTQHCPLLSWQRWSTEQSRAGKNFWFRQIIFFYCYSSSTTTQCETVNQWWVNGAGEATSWEQALPATTHTHTHTPVVIFNRICVGQNNRNTSYSRAVLVPGAPSTDCVCCLMCAWKLTYKTDDCLH